MNDVPDSGCLASRLTPDDNVTGPLLSAQRRIVEQVIEKKDSQQEIDLDDAYTVSGKPLKGYVTVDCPHVAAIKRVQKTIRDYAEDKTRSRPLNILLSAEPGTGKSHLVKCLAASLKQYGAIAVNYNMTSLQSTGDLIQPLDEVRSAKVQDRFPILFLDEFDCDQRFLPLLLPLLWDGRLNVGQRELKLGKLVVVLAGSSPTVAKAIGKTKSMEPTINGDQSKLTDFLSRINGGELEIPSMDLVSEGRDRRADKVCLAISLLQKRFGPSLETAPFSLLNFVATTTFRYGARSIAHVIDLVLPSRQGLNSVNLTIEQLRLPLDSADSLQGSSLAYHVVSQHGPSAITDRWARLSSDAARVRFRARGQSSSEAPGANSPHS